VLLFFVSAPVSWHSVTEMSTSEYLRTLPSIRERCSKVFALGQQGKLEYFTYHEEKEKDIVEYCSSIIKVRDK
jgi:hypothetical protein